MLVHIGIPACFGSFSRVVSELDGAAALVSANAFYKRKTNRFRTPAPGLFHGVPVALDSAGFVAMFLYKGYRWYLWQYVALAGSFPWLWWAAPDYCCEPEIARDRAEVRARVEMTAAKLAWALAVAEDTGVRPCMPVLQGWRPDDYLRCADLIGRFMPRLPNLVGLGSICRRQMGGPDGVIAIVDRLDVVLPPHVTFHLFGVKGSAAAALRDHPRIASIDSAAWDAAARREAVKRRRFDPAFSCNVHFRSGQLRDWHDALASQLALPGPPRTKQHHLANPAQAPTQHRWVR